MTTYKYATVGGRKIFIARRVARMRLPSCCCMAFPPQATCFVTSFLFWAGRFHLVAPDFPGFGQSDMPERAAYDYTFANIANTISGFIENIGAKKFAIYIFDYGSPVGLRVASQMPDRISAIISQNGNAYEEGLSSGWNPIRAYWQDASQKNRDALRIFLKPETTTFQYTHGVPDPSVVSPDGRSLDDFYLARLNADEVQLDLLKDYASNVALYPQFQEYFRKYQPPLLAVWGKNDPFFLPAGAEAFKRDMPKAQVHFYDTGHFALETHAAEIAVKIRDFLAA
jgi:pimeloyl-ACP methyl ester carboxylesterase